MEDVPLPDPIRMGLPEFDNAPLKKRRSWRPQSPQEEDNREVLYLMGRIKTLANQDYVNMYNAGGAATSISGTTHVALHWRR